MTSTRIRGRSKTISDTAAGVHHTDTEDSEWDGPAAVAAMPNEASVLRYCHAWRDPDGEADEKDTYKFPHHRTEGGPANIPACRNILARVSQADIPDDERAAVERHAQAHIDDHEDGGEEDKMKMFKTTRSVANLKAGRNDWYKVTKNLAEDGETFSEVFIYDEIGFFGVTASDFVNELSEIKDKTIKLFINSPGGSVFDGLAIFNALKRHEARVDVTVDGLAASAASFIAMAGDNIKVSRNAMVMIHDALTLAIGNAADMREMADLLDKHSDNIADIYARRAGGTADKWREAMRAESWYTGAEAVKAGLADEMTDPDEDEEDEDAENSFDLSIFSYQGRQEAPDPYIPEVKGNGAPDSDPEPPVETDPVKEDEGAAPTVDVAAILRSVVRK